MKDEYLPIGYKIGGHYEIVKVLGDDEFEIVYVVKDIHRLGTLFVIKELFLKEYSFRDENSNLYILEKSKESFKKTKESVISEINLFRERGDRYSVQTYGYFEENNTIYTILEFVNNAKLNDYLKITPKKSTKEIEEPKPESKVKIKAEEESKKEEPKSYLFLKMLIASIVLFVALGIYAYNMIEEDKNRPRETTVATTSTKKATIPHPPLIDRTKKKEEKESDISNSRVAVVEDRTEYIPSKEEIKKEQEEKIEIDAGVPTEEIIEIDEPTTTTEETTPPKEDIEVVYVPPKKESVNSRPQESRVNQIDSGPKFNKKEIRDFLESFISATEGNSIDRILAHYDSHVDQYFSLKGATHKDIYKDKIKYNKKWVHRNFELLNFDILNISKIDHTEYCDIRKKIRWSVSTSSGKKASGISNVFMVLKKTASGFKIKTIYSF